MISYEFYCQIQLYYKERGLSFAQIGRELNLDEETVAKWARQKTYCQHLRARRKSKLDPYKPIIMDVCDLGRARIWQFSNDGIEGLSGIVPGPNVSRPQLFLLANHLWIAKIGENNLLNRYRLCCALSIL